MKHQEVGIAPITTVNIIGLGYIGLPTAATLANAGLEVLGVEVRPEIVERINSGNIHIQEPGLDILVRAAIQRGNLRAALEPQPAQAHIIAVPTPVNPDRSPDLSYVESATRTIAKVLRAGDLVVLESTVPPCTCERVVGPLLKELTGLSHGSDYDLSHCPERVIPGQILHEIIHNDRIIGGTTEQATRRTAALYARFVQGSILQTDASTAEMCKLMENTFRDVNIALANELSGIARTLGVDIHEAIALANRHPRVNIHSPGIGVGGHCIPVDPWFIIHSAPEQSKLLRVARAINDARPHEVAADTLEAIESEGLKSVAFFGLSYKPDVDDFRESPAVEIAHAVAESFAGPVYVVEPYAESLPGALESMPNVRLVSAQEALESGALCVSLVAHRAFRTLSPRHHRDLVQVWGGS
jgi:UDP-N-acetyl-D-mannosaminuronic acid dehydrogenase